MMAGAKGGRGHQCAFPPQMLDETGVDAVDAEAEVEASKKSLKALDSAAFAPAQVFGNNVLR